MEMLPWFIYLAGISESVKVASIIAIIVITICLIILGITLFDNFQNRGNRAEEMNEFLANGWKYFRLLFIPIAFFSFVAVFMPSERTIYAIAGTYGAVQVIQAPESRELMEKSLKVINQKLDSMLEPETEKEGKK